MHQGIEYQHRIEQKRKEVAGLEVHDTLKEKLAAYWHSDDVSKVKIDTKKNKSEEKIADLEKQNARKALAKAKFDAQVNTYHSLVQKIKAELDQANIKIGQLEVQDKLDAARAEELKSLQYTRELLQSNLDYFNKLYQGFIDNQTVIKKEIEVIQAQLLVAQDELALLIQIEQNAVLVRDQKAQENKAKIEEAETEIAKLNIQLDIHKKSLQSILNRHKIEENQYKIKQANIALTKLTKQVDIDGKLSEIKVLTEEIRQLIRANLKLEYDMEIAKSKLEDFAEDVQAKEKIKNWEKLKTAFTGQFLSLGVKNDNVKQLRQLLADFESLSFSARAKNQRLYTLAVAQAVAGLQQQLGLPVTGIVDIQTWQKAYQSLIDTEAGWPDVQKQHRQNLIKAKDILIGEYLFAQIWARKKLDQTPQSDDNVYKLEKQAINTQSYITLLEEMADFNDLDQFNAVLKIIIKSLAVQGINLSGGKFNFKDLNTRLRTLEFENKQLRIQQLKLQIAKKQGDINKAEQELKILEEEIRLLRRKFALEDLRNKLGGDVEAELQLLNKNFEWDVLEAYIQQNKIPGIGCLLDLLDYQKQELDYRIDYLHWFSRLSQQQEDIAQTHKEIVDLQKQLKVIIAVEKYLKAKKEELLADANIAVLTSGTMRYIQAEIDLNLKLINSREKEIALRIEKGETEDEHKYSAEILELIKKRQWLTHVRTFIDLKTKIDNYNLYVPILTFVFVKLTQTDLNALIDIYEYVYQLKVKGARQLPYLPGDRSGKLSGAISAIFNTAVDELAFEIKKAKMLLVVRQAQDKVKEQPKSQSAKLRLQARILEWEIMELNQKIAWQKEFFSWREL
ncbi:MAG: peptidoglycan-binding protein, partial [Candidatus Pacebacteria bacterium]|nr:peptidoglycan-binding protein [Candidatus Paceibacterota bacterium]